MYLTTSIGCAPVVVSPLNSTLEKVSSLVSSFLSDSKLFSLSVSRTVFPGGFKITLFDEYLLERCVERDIPTLGICLGMQMMSCYNEDINLFDVETGFEHYQESDFGLTHKVVIDKNSKLFNIIGEESVFNNINNSSSLNVFKANFLNWKSEMIIDRNINCIIFLSVLAVGIIFLIVGIIRHIKKKNED